MNLDESRWSKKSESSTLNWYFPFHWSFHTSNACRQKKSPRKDSRQGLQLLRFSAVSASSSAKKRMACEKKWIDLCLAEWAEKSPSELQEVTLWSIWSGHPAPNFFLNLLQTFLTLHTIINTKKLTKTSDQMEANERFLIRCRHLTSPETNFSALKKCCAAPLAAFCFESVHKSPNSKANPMQWRAGPQSWVTP